MNQIVKIWVPIILLAAGLGVGYFTPHLSLAENIIRWVLFFSVGVQGVWAWWGQTFFSKQVAASIGWADSPFLFEVAVANLGNGVAGLLAPWMLPPYWLALIIVGSIFSWGAAYGHVVSMVKDKNFAINNCGPVFFTDVFIPVILIVSYYLR